MRKTSEDKKYDHLDEAKDNEMEAKTMANLKQIHEEYVANPTLALARLMQERPVFFTHEEMTLAFGFPNEMEINRDNDIKPEMLTGIANYDDLYTTAEEYWEARDRLAILYKSQRTLGSADETADHWTQRKRTKERR